MSHSPPLVSIATPVFNGEAYLPECIESVLSQTHRHLEYHLVDNCSTDRTAEIAERYARQDSRIHVHRCADFVGMIENHNRALSFVSPESKFCKILSADDWLYPEFVARTVDLAETHPTVLMVGSYQLSGGGDSWRVRWTGLPHPRTVIPGREICRHTLLGGRYVFGVPTSTLYRSSLVIGNPAFFPNSRPNADVSSFYQYLQEGDFGFVHQVLSYERIHEQATTSERRKINTHRSDALRELLEYGPIYLTPEELERRKEELLDEFYELLALGVVNLRGREFWAYQKKAIGELGYPFLGLRAGRAVLRKVTDLLLNPKQTATKLVRRFTDPGAVSLGDGIGE